MATSYEKEIQEFQERLDNGEVKVEFITNSGTDYSEKEERDLKAYKNHLNSATCKSLADEVFGNESSNLG